MFFLDTVPPEDAGRELSELYEADQASLGHVANFTRALSLKPEVQAAWRALNRSIVSGMDLRRYELATLAAAQRLRSSYCMLAHGKVMLDKQLIDPDTLRAAVEDRAAAGLDELDVAVMELAEQVVDDAGSVTQADVDRLRALGLPDAEILGVMLAAAARCFFSKAIDAAGAQPDAKFAALDPALRDALTVGRPIAAL
jgi:uncharacterized peroxidase-related enzyme